ncbi:MAG: BrnT family toxin [Micropepsaceae bacterium]
MRYEWDEEKRTQSRLKHGVDFVIVETFAWSTALVVVDDREDYDELREIAVGFIGVGLYVMAFTMRADDLVRVIMLRKATRAEARRYAEAQEQE